MKLRSRDTAVSISHTSQQKARSLIFITFVSTLNYYEHKEQYS
jgi:hypothetical protein